MAGTIKAVAEAAGVSKTTVSFVMNDTHPQVDRIPEETRQRIKAIAARLGYSHNPIAASIRTGRRVWVGVMTDVLPPDWLFWEWAPFFDLSFLYGVQHELAEHSYFTLLALRKPEREAHDMDQLATAKIGGLILRAADPFAIAKCQELLESGVHVVNVFPRHRRDLHPWIVDLDNVRAGRLAAEIVVRSGSRNPAFVCITQRGFAMDDRIDGFCQAIRNELGVAPGEIDLPQTASGEVEALTARKMIESYIRNEKPDAIVALDGGCSFILNGSLDEVDVNIPADLVVVGFDLMVAENLKYRNMSTIGMSWLRAGQVAARLVVDQLENRESITPPVLLDPVFLPGDSTPPSVDHELAVEGLNSLISLPG